MAKGAIKHWGIFLKKLFFAILAISCGLCFYQLGQQYGGSFNLQRSHKTATEEFTLQTVLESLEEPLEVYVSYEDVSPFVENLRYLWKTYQCTAPEKIQFTFIDIIKQPRILQDLTSRFGSITRNQVLLAYKGDRCVLPSETFFDTHGRFCGESVLLGFMMSWAHYGSKKILFTSGHGEIDPESVHPYFGGSEWKISLQQRGYQLKKTELLDALSVDDTLLIIAGPKVNFSKSGLIILQKFLHDGGRVLLLLSPPCMCGFGELLEEHDVRGEGIIDKPQMSDNFFNLNGEFLVKNFGDYPKLQQLQGLSVLLPQSYWFRTDHSPEKSIVHQLMPLLLLSEERRECESQDFNSKNEDSKALAVLSAPVGTRGSGGKLLVIGSSNLVENRYFNDLGNRAFMNALVDIMLEKDGELSLEFAPKNYKFSLQDSDWKRIIIGLLSLVLCLLVRFFVAKNSQQKRK
ncbi:MAG: GldG family protein [Verrucomicrobiota bacterium]|nr:MAG: GldG family protein [Verrucomicrobiota bacterium]